MDIFSSSQFHYLHQLLYRSPYPLATLISLPFLAAVLALLATYIITTIQFHLFLAVPISSNPTSNNNRPLSESSNITSPVLLPYTIPWLGHALSFLAPRPGVFFDSLLRVFPPANSASVRSTQLLLAGRRMFVLWDVATVQALFRNRSIGRHEANVQVVQKSLGMNPMEMEKYYAPIIEKREKAERERKGLKPLPMTKSKKEWIDEDKLNEQWLLGQASVNHLTEKFVEVFRGSLLKLTTASPLITATAVTSTGDEWAELDLYTSLRPLMFHASTTAFMGQEIFSIYKQRTQWDLYDDFFELDRYILSMFLGIPKWIAPAGFVLRERMAYGIEGWVNLWSPAIDLGVKEKRKLEDAGNDDDDENEDTVWWEPNIGSRYVHERQRMYDNRGLSANSRARLDMGLLFGLSSNAIPATGWMMGRILTIEGLLERVREEIRVAIRPVTHNKRANGHSGDHDENPPDTGPGFNFTIDVPTLVVLPLFNSIFHETLRLYTDFLVSRDIFFFMILRLTCSTHHPSSSSSSSRSTTTLQPQLLLKKNSLAVCPSWMGHRDPTPGIWGDHLDTDVNTFDPDRFLHHDPETGKTTFSTANKSGKFFPFGGGKTICPGRVFARQEVLAAVALMVYGFEWRFEGFVDADGKKREDGAGFPGLKKAYSGTGIMAMDGDVRVQVRRRKVA